jgi:hypothetical protein
MNNLCGRSILANIDRVIYLCCHTRRSENLDARKPQFRITERIDYDRRRLVENRVWVDRLDELTPEVVEWRNSRASYQKRQ